MNTKLTSESEETSVISKISYEVENTNNNGLPKNRIMAQTEKLKDDNKFPSNLAYVDSYINPNTRTT
ncbi:hypothetical protein LZT98_12155 [Staphylococcus epidermidis]|uniref:hypothetical protein n=1 Tax=Staphylococcus epidermidis TaxID=1282 RepID=UPI0011A1084F|nr:hypothetical protein [Staphylococcus epidermidis]MCO6303199.1 hypothetical protein [Staphylococcus epidermidis]